MRTTRGIARMVWEMLIHLEIRSGLLITFSDPNEREWYLVLKVNFFLMVIAGFGMIYG